MISRQHVYLLSTLFSLASHGPAQGATVGLSRIAGGLRHPTTITHAGDDSGRLFILEQDGRIRIRTGNGLRDAPFLDITDRVLSGGERGLLGLAFPPGFAGKRYFYVYYTSASGDNVMARYFVSDADPDLADANSEAILLTIPHQDFANHNGGQLAFSPVDGYLYIGVGDGGGGGDPNGNAQNKGSLLGKLLRIDVESGAIPYAIPPDNPFVADPEARPEVWAYGLRNPWRFSFDRETGEMYIADVGQEKFEEVNFQSATSAGGENYGWNRTESFHCYPVDDGSCNVEGIVMPVVEYDHAGGNCSITGGYSYRGRQFPVPDGFMYVYADFCSGRIWGLLWDTVASWHTTVLIDAGFAISSFGEDQDGSLYVAAYGEGAIYVMTASQPAQKPAHADPRAIARPASPGETRASMSRKR